MRLTCKNQISALLTVTILLLTACASLETQNIKLPVLKGQMELDSGAIDAKEISLPTTEILAGGSAFLFTPVEFAGHRVKLGLEEITSPLGHNVALRRAEEGLLQSIKPGQARTLDVRYQTRFNSLEQAKEKFPHLSDEVFIPVNRGGQDVIEVTNWKFRFVMIFSSDRRAFRVLIDNIDYSHPFLNESGELQHDQEMDGKIPVLISFAYSYPDVVQHVIKQTNIIFDYMIELDKGTYQGKPQLSNWIPMQDDAETAPYSIEIAVAEIRKKEEFLLKIPEWIKSIRSLL